LTILRPGSWQLDVAARCLLLSRPAVINADVSLLKALVAHALGSSDTAQRSFPVARFVSALRGGGGPVHSFQRNRRRTGSCGIGRPVIARSTFYVSKSRKRSGANPNNRNRHWQAGGEGANDRQGECEKRIYLRAHIVYRHVAYSTTRINRKVAPGRMP